MKFLSAMLTLGLSAATPAVAQSAPADRPAPGPFEPCTQEPCGLGLGPSRPIVRKPISEAGRAFLQTRLFPTVSRQIAASAYFREMRKKKHCQVTFTVVLGPGKIVSHIVNLQERDAMFMQEFSEILRTAVNAWRGDLPDDVIDRPFTYTLGYSLMPCRRMRSFGG